MTGLRATEPGLEGGDETSNTPDSLYESYLVALAEMIALNDIVTKLFKKLEELIGLEILNEGDDVRILHYRLSHAYSVILEELAKTKNPKELADHSFIPLTKGLISDAIRIYQLILHDLNEHYQIDPTAIERTAPTSNDIPDDPEKIMSISEAFLEIPIVMLLNQYVNTSHYARYINGFDLGTIETMRHIKTEVEEILEKLISTAGVALGVAFAELETEKE